MKINVICIGGLKEKYWRDACAEYQKRLTPFCKLNIIELDECRVSASPSAAEIDKALATEGKSIAQKIGNSAVVSLCIEGDMLRSEQLSEKIESFAVSGISKISFVIGGSHGLCEDIKKQSRLRLSMSRMTFPHQLARVLLLEQIYRAFKISEDSAYHK